MMPHKIFLTPFMVKVISMIDKYDVPFGISITEDNSRKWLMLDYINKTYIVSSNLGELSPSRIYSIEYGDKNIVKKIDVTYDGIEEWVKSLK